MGTVHPRLPPGIDLAGQWSWRLLGVIGVLAIFGYLIATLEEIVVPFLIALLLTAFLRPLVNFLVRHRWPRWVAVLVSVLAAFGVIAGLVLLVETQVSSGLPEVEKRSLQAYQQFRNYLRTSPLQVSSTQFDAYLVQLGQDLKQHGSEIFSGALVVGKTAGRVLAGTLLTVFATIFMLIDGGHVWRWTVRLFPRDVRAAVDGAGQAGWLTLTNFVRVQILVAAGDAVGIGLFAFFLGLPMVIPIAILVFLASFIPVVGAIVTGALAVLVALVYVGPIQALVMLAGVLLVHLLEAHVIQPLVMGAAVKVHPLAVVFAVAAGSYIAGIPGALFAVPTVAVLNVMVGYIAGGKWRTEREAGDPDRSAEGGAALRADEGALGGGEEAGPAGATP
ncbi:AI-2E family transporter [Paeniglutamicibacter cryotolerans]